MGTISRTTWTDDDGTGTTGSIINNSELQAIYAAVEGDIKSANFPTVTTKSVQDNMLAGQIKHFGGNALAPFTNTSYAAGATGDDLASGTSMWSVDAALLAAGTYKIVAMLHAGGGATVSVALFNLTDAPTTAMATASGTSTTGLFYVSGTITWPGGGAAKSYGIKVKVDTGVGILDGVWLVRTA